MRSLYKRPLALLCAVAVLLGALSLPALAADNRGAQDYDTWASPVTSYLYVDGAYTVRVEFTGESVLVEYYDAQFYCRDSFSIPAELPLWGGFFAGKDYNYLFFGQENLQEDDETEVIRVVQYDKNWSRLGSTGLFGANTTRPFRAGTLRCDEYGGYLYVRTSHEMYHTEDGFNHQSSLTFCLRQRDLTITDSLTTIANNAAGYVSHSFNQYILVDQSGTILTLDHGDAYPRGVIMMQYRTRAGGDSFVTRNGRYFNAARTLTLFTIPGQAGENQTGVSLGGLAETSQGYLTAYSRDPSNSGESRSVYLSFIPKGDISSAIPYVQTLSNPGASAPQMVATGLDGGYVMWNGADGVSLYCVRYAADASVTALIQGAAPLSDCQPIPYQDGVLWYVTENGQTTFYFLNNDGVRYLDIVPGLQPPQPSEPEPSEPQPSEPEPSEPEPSEPQPSEPEPSEPEPSEPEPSEPQPSEPEPPAVFSDVPSDQWYASYVAAAYEGGLMQGSGDGRFSPLRTLTLAEVVALTARVHAHYNGLTVSPSQGDEPWYMGAYRYCVDNGITSLEELPVSALTVPAIRFEMVLLLDRATPSSQKAPILSQVSIPDLSDSGPYGEMIYRWYAAGITQGDQNGYFNGESYITRAETAAILCRLVRLVPRIGE